MGAERLQHILGQSSLPRDILEPPCRCFECTSTCCQLLRPVIIAFSMSGMREAKPLHDMREHEALANKGYQNDRECQEEDEIAIGKCLATRCCKGYRECRGQRHDSTNPGEGKCEWPLPWGSRVPAPELWKQPARNVRSRVHPDEARYDDDHTNDRCGNREFGQGIASNPCNEGVRLESRDEEHHALNDVDEEVPEENTLQPRR